MQILFYVGYLCFIVEQALMPLISRIWSGDFADALYDFYPILSLLATVCLALWKKLTLKELLHHQAEYILCYALGGLNVFFAWNVYHLKGHTENSLDAFVTYLTIFLCNFLYSVVSANELSTPQYVVVQCCAVMRLFAYALQTQTILENSAENEELKDFYLLFMAT